MLIVSSQLAVGQENTLTLFDIEQAPILAKNQAYLLVRVDVSGIAPSFNFAHILKKKGSYAFDSDKQKLGEKYAVSLKGVKTGFYLLAIKTGHYQITRVNAPFYNLPYWRPTNNVSWQFSISANKINFIGELNIANERGSDYISVNLFNRFATYQATMSEQLTLLLEQYALVNGKGIRDDFVEELEGN